MQRWTLEKINKWIFLVALFSLLIRTESFSTTHLLNPFEILFIISSILFVVDIVFQRKIRVFVQSIKKPVWIALIVLFSSVAVGSILGGVVSHIPFSQNMLMEFGTFMIAVATFCQLAYYTASDPAFGVRALYALLSPAVFIIFVLVPHLAYSTHLITPGNVALQGFTLNTNIFSKTLLIPALFFMSYALGEVKSVWIKFSWAVLAALTITLQLWSIERGGMLALAVGIAFVWAWYTFSQFNWKKLLRNTILILLIVCAGFLMAPLSVKKIALNRILNFEKNQLPAEILDQESVGGIFLKSVTNPTPAPTVLGVQAPDSRLAIWPYYLRYIIRHPLGIGPNTHVAAHIQYQNRTFINSGPHNSYLELLLWGGIGALGSVVYLLWYSVRNLFRKGKELTPYVVALGGILVALSVAILFNDSIQSYWLWSILALAICI